MLTDRAPLVAALNTVAGVDAFASPPKTLKAGFAWTLLEGGDHSHGVSWVVTWRLLVLLDQDPGLAQDRADALLPLLLAAVDPVAYVDAFEIVTVTSDAGDWPAIALTVTRE